MKSRGETVFLVAAVVFVAAALTFGVTVVKAVRVAEVPTSGEGVSASTERTPGSPEGARTSTEQAPTSTEGARGAPVEGMESPAAPDETAETEDSPGSEGVMAGWTTFPLPPSAFAYPSVTEDELLEAVNHDLFQPDRIPPLQPYLLPSERETLSDRSRDRRRRREPDLRIVGTAISGDVALAVVQLEDSIPFAVLLGEEVEGYRLAAVNEETVTLTGYDSEFVFPVVEPERGRRSSSRDRNSRESRSERDARAVAERVQQMLQNFQRGQGGRIQGGQGAQVRLLPRALMIQRGNQTGGVGGVVVRPRGGGGNWNEGGGTLP